MCLHRCVRECLCVWLTVCVLPLPLLLLLLLLSDHFWQMLRVRQAKPARQPASQQVSHDFLFCCRLISLLELLFLLIGCCCCDNEIVAHILETCLCQTHIHSPTYELVQRVDIRLLKIYKIGLCAAASHPIPFYIAIGLSLFKSVMLGITLFFT